MNLATWESGGTDIELMGHRIFVRREGSGPVLLTLHGFPTASWDWVKIWPELTSHFDVLAFDFLGFGLSAKPASEPLSIVQQADVTEALLAHFGVSEAHVLAHDYGNTVGQELLARDAARDTPIFRSVCFLNGGLFPETHRPRLIQKLLLTPLGPAIARLSSKRTLKKNFDRIFGEATRATPEEIDTFWELMIRNDGRSALPRLIRYIPQRVEHRERWVGALKNGLPTKLINGSVDPVSGEHMIERYTEVVGQPDVTRLPTIGHYPQTEAPAEVLDAFLAFHRGLGSIEQVAR